MITKHIPAIFGALAVMAALAAPALAAEAIEAKLQNCGLCHGENGQPIDAKIPIIWGRRNISWSSSCTTSKAATARTP